MPLLISVYLILLYSYNSRNISRNYYSHLTLLWVTPQLYVQSLWTYSKPLSDLRVLIITQSSRR